MREPDIYIGGKENPYLKRWWIIPRNRFFNVYLHQFVRDDDDVMHDHPWWNLSIILKGGYYEVTPGQWGRDQVAWRGRGSLLLRRPTAAHRLALSASEPDTWTLFLTGPIVRVWGFYCKQGWRPFHEVTRREGNENTMTREC